MILIWANFNAQSFIHLKLSMQCSELFFYVSTCLQQQWLTYTLFEPYSVLRPLDNSFLTWHLLVLLTYILVHMLTFLKSQSLHHRNRTELTPENLKHLENVFRENLAKDKDEFTLAEFKKIVPSKNVIHFILLYYYLQP